MKTTGYKKIIVLEAVFDDSDPQTDYFHRDRSIFEWYVCETEGKRVTERKLRKALKLLPEWLRAYDWRFRKGEKYSMSDHWYGQLRLDENIGLTVKGEHTYSHYDKPLRFILTATSLGTFQMNRSVNDPIPETKDEMRDMLERKQAEWSLRYREQREKCREAHIKVIQQSHAIIDGNGFRVLTEEEKKRQIEEYLRECGRKDEEEKERLRRSKPKNLLDFILESLR